MPLNTSPRVIPRDLWARIELRRGPDVGNRADRIRLHSFPSSRPALAQDMSAAEIKALMQPPSAERAQAITLQWLNDRFPTFDQLQDADDLEQLVQHSASEAEQLRIQVDGFALLYELRYLLRRRSSASFLARPSRLYHCTNPTRCEWVSRDGPGIGTRQRFAFGRVIVSV